MPLVLDEDRGQRLGIRYWSSGGTTRGAKSAAAVRSATLKGVADEVAARLPLGLDPVERRAHLPATGRDVRGDVVKVA